MLIINRFFAITSSAKLGLLLVVLSSRGVIAILISFFNDLLYDEATDSPDIQEITDARNPHPGGETVPAGVDHPT